MTTHLPVDSRCPRGRQHEDDASFDLPITGRPANARVRVTVTDGTRSSTAEAVFGFVAR
ncbi:MAG TPA: hypothetical protein VMO26_01100 [Vicinamibacterales bacterium]|nr:hypothetical protein [Vicinamibacterales bacterium]